MNTPGREGETIEGSRTMRNRPYPVLKCSSRGCGAYQNPPLWDFAQSLDSESSPIPAVSAVIAADWLRLDGRMET